MCNRPQSVQISPFFFFLLKLPFMYTCTPCSIYMKRLEVKPALINFLYVLVDRTQSADEKSRKIGFVRGFPVLGNLLANCRAWNHATNWAVEDQTWYSHTTLLTSWSSKCIAVTTWAAMYWSARFLPATGSVAMEASSDGEEDGENTDKVTETVMNGSMKETLSLTVDAKTETAVFKRWEFTPYVLPSHSCFTSAADGTLSSERVSSENS